MHRFAVVVAALSGSGEFLLGFPPSSLDYWKHDVQHGLEHGWTEQLREHKISHRTKLVEDTPWKALLSAAEAEGADAVVIGQHRHGALTGGSEMDKVIRHTHLPVIVIPDGSPEDRPGE
jgi:nucleotide-binding universal stress UspA family protein